MIVENKNNKTIETNGDVTSFGIQLDATMYRMLTKDVYSDNIAAPIREWSTNAVDACIAANKPVKVDVTLPTKDDLTFAVRDYGTGLTDEELTTLFTTIGASSKRNSNKYNGTYGIGRLSGLAYANEFLVESFKDGNHSSYLVTLSNGEPAMVNLNRTTTNEENGIRISLKVEDRDINEFLKKASLVYRYFTHQVNTNVPINTDIETMVSGTGWVVEKLNRDTMISPKVVMANVAYRIDLPMGIIPFTFYVDTGDISITPGREVLNYDDMTTNKLEDMYQKANAELKDILEKHLKSIPKGNYYEYIKFRNMLYCLGIKSSMRTELKQHIEIDGLYDRYNYELRSSRVTDQYNIKIRKRDKYNKETKTYRIADIDPKFVVIDTTKNVTERLDKCYEKDRKHVFTIRMQKFSKNELEDFKGRTKAFLDRIAITNYEYLSDIEVDTETAQKSKVKTPRIKSELKPDKLHSGTILKALSKKLSEYTHSCLYIYSNRGNIEDKARAYSTALHAKKSGIDVLVIPASYRREAESMNNLTHLYEYVDNIKDSMKFEMVIDTFPKTESYKDLLKYRNNRALKNCSKLPNELKKLLDYENKSKYDLELHEADVIKQYGFKITTRTFNENTNAKELIKKYDILLQLAYSIEYDRTKHYMLDTVLEWMEKC